jgi:hypothetical protein
MSADPVIRITVEDLVDGGTESVEVPAGDYFIVCTEPCHETGVQVFPGRGTHVITVKGRIQQHDPAKGA